MPLIIRPLIADDTSAYRALRHRILCSEEAAYFSDSFERERQLDDSQWREWCKEKLEHCILGAFDTEAALVGVMMIRRQGDGDSPIVVWEALWLDPQHRRGRLCKSIFGRAEQWTKEQGYSFAAAFIRETNIRQTINPTINICHKLGFVDAYTVQDDLWADGSVANVRALLRDLRPNASEFDGMPVFERFKEALPYLVGR